MPFYGAEYNENGRVSSPCCLLPQNVDVSQLQKDALNGVKSTACQKCWTLEEQGKISDRQLKNSAFDFYSNKDIQIIEEECQIGKFVPKIIQLYTSNLCNSTCVTCGAEASTAWATLNKKKTFKIIDQHLLGSIDFTEIIMLSFVGGEPLFEKRNFSILENLIKVNNTNCFISATTNGSVTLSIEQINILKQFKNINLCLSIDGVGPVFEYMRYPLKWSVLLANIELYRSLNINLSVSYTISNLNVLYYQETINWFESMQLPYNHNIINDPAYFHPGVLPKEIKSQHSNLSLLFEGGNEELLTDFYSEIARQDQLKGISINDYLPDMVSSGAVPVAK